MENKIKIFITENKWRIAGITIGLIGGFLYYRFVGCNSGTCPITSNPWISTLYGGVIGYLLSDIIKKKPSDKKYN